MSGPRSREASRDSIESAALALFTDRGFARTSVGAICREAKVSPATFYRCFRSKDDVVFAFQPEWLDGLDASVDDALTGPVDVERLAASFAAFLDTNRERAFALDKLVRANPELMPAMLTFQRRWEQVLVDALVRDQRVEPHDAQLIGSLVVAVLRNAMRRAAESSGSIAAEVPGVACRVGFVPEQTS